MPRHTVPLTPGERYGRLTVLEYPVPGVRKQGSICARLLCDCGNTLVARAPALKSGNTTSCGCYQRGRRFRHGWSRTSEYKTWTAAKVRCTNPKDPRYPHYGGRGIKMCGRWMESFPAFLEDMGPRPSRLHTLERVDVNGNYEPGNCTWATYSEQNRNLRRNVLVRRNGRNYFLADLAKAIGIRPATALNRRRQYGWPEARWLEPFTIEEAVAAFESGATDVSRRRLRPERKPRPSPRDRSFAADPTP
jgi:hypothetical protein